MTTQRRIGSPATAALLCIAFVLLASSCAPKPSVVSTPPSGGPVPAQLLGDWLLPAVAANNYLVDSGVGRCPKPLALATCTFKLSFTASTYYLATNVVGLANAGGNAVVNGTEIDFFKGNACPGAVGRYKWTLTGGVLHLVSLMLDPCARGPYPLAKQSFSRTGNNPPS
jgi:hypothetical protein